MRAGRGLYTAHGTGVDHGNTRGPTPEAQRSPRVCHISTMLGGMVAWCLWWHGTYQLVAAKSNRQNRQRKPTFEMGPDALGDCGWCSVSKMTLYWTGCKTPQNLHTRNAIGTDHGRTDSDKWMYRQNSCRLSRDW